jgi:DNA-binding CsgD family transcriptional regulator
MTRARLAPGAQSDHHTAVVPPVGSDVAGLTDIALPPTSDPGFDTAADQARSRLEYLICDGDLGTAALTRACSTLVRLDELQRARASVVSLGRSTELAAYAELSARLEDLDPADLVDRGAAELCSAMGFERTLFSTVTATTWRPRSLFVEPELDEDAGELRSFLAGAAWCLDAAPLESEVIRRRRPRLVDGAQSSTETYKPLMKASQSHSYVVAPVWVRGRVLGLLHADRLGEPVMADDVGRVEAYAECFGAAAEEAMLRSRLRRLATGCGEALAAASARVAAFDGGIDVVAESLRTPEPRSARSEFPILHDDASPASEPAGGLAAYAGLSPRESQVLLEMAAGRTNADIAARLGVTEGTVKSYVKGVLRKLDVPTRAAAAAYLRRHGIPSGRPA